MALFVNKMTTTHSKLVSHTKPSLQIFFDTMHNKQGLMRQLKMVLDMQNECMYFPQRFGR